jgi:cytochrome c
VAAGVAVAGVAQAADEAEIAKAGGCATCHTLDAKKKGPSYKEIAAKYKGKAGAEAKLTEGAVNGYEMENGKKHPKSKTSEEDTKTLVKWILTQ